MASLAQWCKNNGEPFDEWWPKGEHAEAHAVEIHHFIGKDITYFHTLFWPAMLKAAKFKLPNKVHIHGFLTVGGEKMSKSKGTFVRGATYLEHLDPAYLRYYYASKLTSKLDDLDLNLEEFVNKVNADLVGKVVNIASRTAGFLVDCGFASNLSKEGEALFRHGGTEVATDDAAMAPAGHFITGAFEMGAFGLAIVQIMDLAE